MISGTTKKIYDFVVIGGGILGLATAWQLQQKYPKQSVLLLEKESGVARHQTGRNSGVIHAGVYYKPDSLKAKFCKQGNLATKDFCRQRGITFEEKGKLLVATNSIEVERLQALADRCHQNGIEIERIDKQKLKELEPNIQGEEAIRVASSAIVDYAQIAQEMKELIVQAGGEVYLNAEVVNQEEFADRVTLYTKNDRFQARHLIICAGLHSDHFVRMIGKQPDFRIIPFRGEYFRLNPEYNSIVNHLIYPVPDPNLPFLGVHLTPMIDGSITLGPNAVLALSREGYNWTDIKPKEMMHVLTYSGTLNLLRRHFKAGLDEFKDSISKRGYLKRVRKYCPILQVSDMQPYPAGVRAQAVRANGELVDDFLFTHTSRTMVVCNAPSPAATSAIPIANYIIEKLEELII